jgi:hypothetical protein
MARSNDFSVLICVVSGKNKVPRIAQILADGNLHAFSLLIHAISAKNKVLQITLIFADGNMGMLFSVSIRAIGGKNDCPLPAHLIVITL